MATNEGLMKRVETLENDSARFFVGLSHANISINALCDVLESLISDYIDTQYSGAGVENTDEMLFDLVKARIPNGTQEAPNARTPNVGNNNAEHIGVDTGNIGDGDTDAGGDVEAEVDAQLEQLRRDFESLARIRIPSTTIFDANERRLDKQVALVRPHLEKWAQKVAELESNHISEDWQLQAQGMESDSLRANLTEMSNALEKERQRAEQAEARLKQESDMHNETLGALNECKAERDRAEELKCDAVAQVARLNEARKKADAKLKLNREVEGKLGEECDALKAQVARLREVLKRVRRNTEDVDHYVAELVYLIVDGALAESEGSNQ